MSIEDSVFLREIYGCLIGGLVGDAMGGPSESMHYKENESKFGKITHMMDYRGKPAGHATDDSALKHENRKYKRNRDTEEDKNREF